MRRRWKTAGHREKMACVYDSQKRRVTRPCSVCGAPVTRAASAIAKANVACGAECRSALTSRQGTARWQSLTDEEQCRAIQRQLAGSDVRPTAPERAVIEICAEYGLPLDYVGNGDLFVRYPGGSPMNPDFVGPKGARKCVEVFGNYWHEPDEEQSRTDALARAGMDCLVLWESDIYNGAPESIAGRIADFLDCTIAAKRTEAQEAPKDEAQLTLGEVAG